MREYKRQDDWRLNNEVKIQLVRRWIDVSKMKISTTKGICEISGELIFTGQNADLELQSKIHILKDMHNALKGLPMMRDVKWNLHGWQKMGNHFSIALTDSRRGKTRRKSTDV